MTLMAGILIKRYFPVAALSLMTAAGCVIGDETVSGYADRDAVWQLEKLDGEVFDVQAHLMFPMPGQVAGKGPCNSFSANQNVPYPWIQIERLAATRMACPDLQQERHFFRALQDMTLAEVSGDILLLSNDAGRQMQFRALQP